MTILTEARRKFQELLFSVGKSLWVVVGGISGSLKSQDRMVYFAPLPVQLCRLYWIAMGR